MAQDDLDDPGAVRCAGCGAMVAPDAAVPITATHAVGQADGTRAPVSLTLYACGAEACMAAARVRAKSTGRMESRYASGAEAVADFDAQFPA